MANDVIMAFEAKSVHVKLADILPVKQLPKGVLKTRKFLQIAASIREVGIIEPPVVARERKKRGKYLLLDGHLRIEVLKDMGANQEKKRLWRNRPDP